MPPATTTTPAWELQPGESPKAFHAFGHYRDMPHPRSVDRAYAIHKSACHAPGKTMPGRWNSWCAEWHWVERVYAYDLDISRLAREKLLNDQVEARLRHARLAQNTLAALAIPVRAAVDALKDPQVITTMTNYAKLGHMGMLQLLAVVSKMAQVMPGLIAAERQALGLSIDPMEADTPRDDDVIALSIASDPETTAMAIQLLDRVVAQTPAAQALLTTGSSTSTPTPPVIDAEPVADDADGDADADDIDAA